MLKFRKPIAGKLLDITHASDTTFKEKLLGAGFSIIPESDLLYAPIAGVIEMIYPTKHTFSIKYDHDQYLLIHMGVDYKVDENTFLLYFKLNDKVEIGAPLVKIDLSLFNKQTKHPEIYFTFVESNELEIIDQKNEKEQDLLLLNVR